MENRTFIRNKGNLLLFIAAILLLALSLLQNFEAADTAQIARKTEKRIEERLEDMDGYISSALLSDTSKALDYNTFPEDMVIYRYVNDTLQAWRNQFPILNDDITSKVVYQRISTMSDRITSPLAKIREKLQYINLGTKWYVAKMVEEPIEHIKIIAGLEIKNDLVNNKSGNGINPNLGISRHYSIRPISDIGGSVVRSGDIPLFKISLEENLTDFLKTNSILRWISLFLIMVSGIIFLKGHRNWRAWITVTTVNSLFILLTYFWGMGQQGSNAFFSPAIYADGPVLYSFGAIFLLNLLVFNFIFCTYIIQKALYLDIRRSKDPRRGFIIQGAVTVVALILTLLYINWGFRSINLNSNISLSFYRWNENAFYSVLVYISYLSLLCAVMMELKCLKPSIQLLTGKNFNPTGKIPILLLVLLSTIYFSMTFLNLGFTKEMDRCRVWSNKMTLSRDLELEFNIRSVEDHIANDKVMATLSRNVNENQMTNRIIEYYLHGQYQKYYISVYLVNDRDKVGREKIRKIISEGERISNDSRFFSMDDKKGFISYAGIFTYRGKNLKKIYMILSLESRESRGDRGYYSLLRKYYGDKGVNLPQFYSYAKYINGRLSNFKGRYPYPTRLAQKDLDEINENNFSFIRKNKYTHFVNRTSEDEIILISRQSGNMITFFTSISYLFLIEWLVLHLFFVRKKIHKTFKKNYYRSRISTILFMTSVFILVGITTVSLLFVFQRNEVNLKNIMSSRISMLQSHVESKLKDVDDYHELIQDKNCMVAIQEIGDITLSDLTLFTPRGKVLLSTTPEVFESMIVGSRINAVAYHNIVDLKQRFYVHDEQFEGRYYYSMYAPIMNEKGEMIAILSAPYTEENFNFKMETVMHTALVVNLFIILLISSMFFSTHEVDEMFKPLLEMGKKMSKADLNNLEYIEYNREDEISKIVEEYNRMVKALQESKVILAKAERNKAWSEMARQIAHEIKNPLTPIQLELQMLIRKKKNNDPVWIERFDKACDVILEHIKILTDTANLFSSVAKIYDDEPQKIDLDALVKKHISIYENKENIKVSYMGMPDCFIMAPRSQIIRVVVNLMTNAIQAIENMQAEQIAAGEKPTDGAVVICLRRSTKDGCFDLVVEDNGPGVKDENLDKLFLPNFTTKSSGTGLGLAICRNIIEECRGEINYKKSFVLKGASFTVTLPRYED